MRFQSTQHLECVLVGIIELFAGSFSGLAHVLSSGRIGFCDDLARASFAIHEHLLAAFLGLVNDRGLLKPPGAFNLCTFQCLARISVRFLDDLVAHFEYLLSLPQVRWNSEPHLVDDVEHPFAVDHQVATDGQPSRLDNQFFQRVDEVEYFHRCPVRAQT